MAINHVTKRVWRIEDFGVLLTRHFCDKSNPKSLDTLAMARRLAGEGIPSNHAESITEVLRDGLQNVSQSLASKGEMQRNHHFSLLQHETEKLRNDIEKIRTEMKNDIKLMQNDINMRHYELKSDINDLKSDIKVTFNELRAQMEVDKYNVIQHCIGAVLSSAVLGFTAVSIMSYLH
ncbi:hypothetical protein VNO78_34990 [Psophocarpus tetragonolobus]|uniref:Uncharacterized protein n=1 Tax=Psophocarpus tetragonolobus TaxID=3891 RepID=A0AAN9NNK0_PSOTE